MRTAAFLCFFALFGQHASSSSSACDTCRIVARVANDFLCDFELIGAAIDAFDENICKALDKDDERETCEQVNAAVEGLQQSLILSLHAQLAAVLIPMFIEYARESAMPNAVCSGICAGGSPAAEVGACPSYCTPGRPDARLSQVSSVGQRKRTVSRALQDDTAICAQCEYVLGYIRSRPDFLTKESAAEASESHAL